MPEGVGRSFDLGGGGQGGQGGRWWATGGGGRAVSSQEVAQRHRVESRINLLKTEIPQLSVGNEALLVDLAMGDMDDDTMMRSAISAVGAIEVEGMISELKQLPDDQQRGYAATMNPTKLQALMAAGWSVPQEKKKGFWDRVADVTALLETNPVMRLGHLGPGPLPGDDLPLEAGGKALAQVVSKAATLPVISQGLAAMDYVAEEATRTQRVTPMMDSGRRLQERTGMSASQLEAETGIDTSLASAEGKSGELLPNVAFGTMNPLNAMLNPGDLWKAARTWVEIGHEGDDDFLPEVQYEVFQKLEEDHGDKARDVLRYAKAVASGVSPEDLAEDEGISGDQAEVFKQQLGMLQTTAAFRSAVSRLESGRVSFGRSIARGVWDDPTKDVSEGTSRYVSGISDAFFAVAADPTIVAGKVSKSVKAYRWGFKAEEGVGKLNRAQALVKAAGLADELGDDAPEVLEALAHIPNRGFRAANIRGHSAGLLVEARAYAAPARAVAKAFETRDFGPLVHQFPAFERSISDMKQFDAALTAVGEDGLSNPAQVFEFYKQVAFDRSVLNTIDNTFRMEIKSSKLFGHDGGGHHVIPHMTGARRKLLAGREEFRNWRYELDPPPAALKEAADEAAAELDEAAGQIDETALAGDPDLSELDEMAIDPDTTAYVRKSSLPAYKEQLNKLIDVFTTPTTKRPVVPVAERVATGPEEFRAFSETFGLLLGESKVTRLARYNRYVNGSQAERHALISQMMADMASATGLTATDEGEALIRKIVEHENHVFGLQDQVQRTVGGQSVLVRQALMEAQLADYISVPSFKDMLMATRKVNVMRHVTGWTRGSVLEASMNRVWKPGQLLRLGFPLRSSADEVLQYIGRVNARTYLNRAVLEKWAGIKGFKEGEFLRKPQGAVPALRWITRSTAHVAGVTDDALRGKAMQLATEKGGREFVHATGALREELLQPYLKEARGNLRWLPSGIRHIDDLSHNMAAMSSQWFHEIAGSKVATSRQRFAEKLLSMQPDYAERVLSNRDMLTHVFVQQAQAEMLGSSFNGLRPGSDSLATRGMTTFGKTGSGATSTYKYIPMRYDMTEWGWVGHNDLSGFYHGLEQWLKNMSESPTVRSAWREMLHYAPQSSIDEIAQVMGMDGLDAVKAAREMAGGLQPTLAAAVEWDSKTLQAYLASIDADVIEALPLLAFWDSLSETSRRLITDPFLSGTKITNDLDLVRARAGNAIYNEARKIDNSSDLASMVRAQSIGGFNVAVPLKDGHTRIYGAMLDRRSAEDLVRLFTDEAMMESFAVRLNERLGQILGDVNLRRELGPIWNAAPPTTEGYDIATWVAGLKANIAQGSGSYIPASMAGSSNFRVAEAMRDALDDVMPEQMLRPTIGYFDHPNELFTEGFGITKLTESTVKMAPHHAAKLSHLDADHLVRQLHVQFPDGKTKMWLADNELEDFVGVLPRFNRADVKRSFSTRAMTRAKGEKVTFNAKLVEQDYADGMKFLKGEGGTFRKEKAAWRWEDDDNAIAAGLFDEALEALGLHDTAGLTFEDLVGLHRSRQLRGNAPIPYEDVMRDAELLDDFVRLADSAKSVGKRTVEEWTDEATAQTSKIVKAALDELDVDLSGITVKQYKDLLIARERAHFALSVPGQRPARTASKVAVQREADAMALALQMTRLSTDEKVLGRVRVAVGQDKGYKILGEIWGSGVTEDAAVRKFSQEVLDEVWNVTTGQKSKEPLYGLVHSLSRGEHRMDDLWNKYELAELPVESFGPTKLVAGDTAWDRVLERYFQGVVEPTISGISRGPIFAENFMVGMKLFQPAHDNIVQKGLNDEALGLLRRAGVDPDDMFPVSRYMFTEIKVNKQWGEDLVGDPVSRYAKAAYDGNVDVANEALSEITGKTVSLTPEELDLLKRWHLNVSDASETQIHRAVMNAMERTAPFIDDHQIRSAFQEYIGPVFAPFYYAEEQFLRRFARGIYETPHMLRKGQLAMNGLRNVGMIREDAYGNEIFVIPGSELLTGAIADVATLLTGNEAYQVMAQPLSMRTDFMIPGWAAGQSRFAWGPMVGLSTEYMTRRWPETEWRTDDPNRSWWEYVVPGPAAGAYKAFLRDGDPTQLASAQMAAVAYLEASGHGLAPDATASEKEEYLENVKDVAKSVGIMRFITGQLSFTAAVPVDTQALIRKEYTDLLNTGISQDDAVMAFLEQHGPEALTYKIFKRDPSGEVEMDTSKLTPEELKEWEKVQAGLMAYTVFGTENQVGAPLPNSTEALKWMFENEELLKNNPASGVWLIPEDKTHSQFDRRAYNEQLALGLRTRRSASDLIDAVRVKAASESYFAARDDYEAQRKVLVAAKNTEGRDRIDREWSAWKDSYMRQHPVFAESFSGEGSQRRQKAVRDLEWMLAAGLGGKQGEAIKPLVDGYLRFQREYASYKNQSSKAAKAAKAAIFTDYFDEAWLYVQANPEAAGFWNSAIRPELPDAADDLEQVKLGAA